MSWVCLKVVAAGTGRCPDFFHWQLIARVFRGLEPQGGQMAGLGQRMTLFQHRSRLGPWLTDLPGNYFAQGSGLRTHGTCLPAIRMEDHDGLFAAADPSLRVQDQSTLVIVVTDRKRHRHRSLRFAAPSGDLHGQGRQC